MELDREGTSANDESGSLYDIAFRGLIPPQGESSASIGNTILGIFSLISRLQRVSIDALGAAGSLSGMLRRQFLARVCSVQQCSFR